MAEKNGRRQDEILSRIIKVTWVHSLTSRGRYHITIWSVVAHCLTRVLVEYLSYVYSHLFVAFENN